MSTFSRTTTIKDLETVYITFIFFVVLKALVNEVQSNSSIHTIIKGGNRKGKLKKKKSCRIEKVKTRKKTLGFIYFFVFESERAKKNIMVRLGPVPNESIRLCNITLWAIF